MTSPSALLLVLLLAGPNEHGTAPRVEIEVNADPYAGNACVQCHRNFAGRSAEIVDREWVNSVHYQNKVACDGCHGGDASPTREQFPSDDAFKQAAHLARNPEFLTLHVDEGRFVSRASGLSVSYLCGRRHTEIMEKHLGSPHGNFGDPSRLHCHGQGSHAIGHADVDIIDTRPRSMAGRCSLCHRSTTMATMAEIKGILQKTTELIDSSAKQFFELEEMGYRNLALGEAHHHTTETPSRLRRVFHGFNLREINELVRSIESVASQTDYAFELVYSLRQARRSQTLVGLSAVVFLLVFAGALVYYKRAFCEHYDRSTAIRDAAPVTPPNTGSGG